MKVFFLMILLFSSFFSVMGQSKADRLFERQDYYAALKLYQKQLESGDSEGLKGEKLKARVANCFFRLNDVVRAGQIYQALNQDNLDAEDLLFLAITYQRSGEYNKALDVADMVEQMGGDVATVEALKASCEFAKEVAKEKPAYAANKTNIDFAGISAGVTYYRGKGIILAAPGSGENAAQDSRGYKFTRLYNAVFSSDGKGGRMTPFADGLVDKYHIGAVTFTKDFNRIYYTKTILKKDGSSILKLMTAVNDNGTWTGVEELNINSDDYSCAHPALLGDSLLFFVSNMPGGYGGKDVYMTRVDGAACDEVQNLGDVVNTPEDELFPTLDDEGNLYFSSTGHIGLGGLDVFVSRRSADGNWITPENMGRPVNSSMDDFALVFKDDKKQEGYVSSNRGGTGNKDFLFALKMLPNREKKAPKIDEKPQVVPKQEMFTVDYRYAIQVGAFRNPVPRVYFEKFQHVKVYLGYDNVYRYTIGEYPDENIAQADLAEVRRAVSDAFVMNVDKYVAEKKIQHDPKGDVISDDELLLIRLKNFERMKRQQQHMGGTSRPSGKKYLNKPGSSEMGVLEGYTIVLMSADRVLNMAEFEGIDDIEVYADGGAYMYCTGLFDDVSVASRQLPYIRQMGFKDAYIMHTEKGVVTSGNTTRPVPKEVRKNNDLKQLLSF